ncbi:MAG: T9SS type A sorting domain-containing protein [Bacteroidales bacterium]
MKKIAFSFLVLLILASLGYPQNQKNDSTKVDWEWAPVGAVWMYSTTGMSGNSYWYVHSEKDTVFNGKECKKLKVAIYEKTSNMLLDVNYRYTFQEDGKIYMYSFGEDEFQQLYDYTATDGDTIRIYCPLAPEDCYGDYYVDSVVERMSGGWPNTTYPLCETNTTINTFHLDYLNTSGWCGVLYPSSSIGTYVSFVGSVTTDMCYVFEGGYNEEVFNCYYDGSVNIFRSKNDSCISYYQEHLDISKNDVNSKIDVYPNPVDNVLNIKLNQPKGDLIKIFDASGRLIYQNHVCSEKHTVSFTDYPVGFYIVTINNNEQLFRKKIIKTKN